MLSERAESAVACALCGGRDAEPVLAAPDWLAPEGPVFTLVRCPRDGLVYLSPRPGPEAIGAHYPEDYEPHEREEIPDPLRKLSAADRRAFDRALGYAREPAGPLDRLRMRRIARRAKWHTASAPFPRGEAAPLLLDYGCGVGNLLAFYRDRGWRAVGVEPSEKARRAARDKGLEVFPDLVSAGLEKGSVSAAVLSHSLEHVHDPKALLLEIRALLRPGGTLLLELPNFASLGRAWLGARWMPLELPRHLYHFTPETLRALLAAAGYGAIAVHQNPTKICLEIGLDRAIAAGAPRWYSWLRRSGPRRLVMKLAARLGRADLMGARAVAGAE